MLQFSIIGNLGKNAEVRNINGKSYYSFSVAHSQKVPNSFDKVTLWIDVLAPGSDKLAQYLVKGTKVFVSGDGSVNQYVGKDGQSHVSVSMFASTLQFCGGRSDDNVETAKQVQQTQPLVTKDEVLNHKIDNGGDDNTLPF